MELDCQIKQEPLEESEEIMIEKIVSFALRVLPKYTAWAKSQWANVGLNSSVTECPIEIILSGITYFHYWFEEFVKSKNIRVNFFQMKFIFAFI